MLDPDRVIDVLSETAGSPLTSDVLSDQLEPASTETYTLSVPAAAALSVAVRV